MRTDATLGEYLANKQVAAPSSIALDHADQRYLEQLMSEILYAQKAYQMALAYMRKKYNTPDSEWALNNIEAGFERIAGE